MTLLPGREKQIENVDHEPLMGENDHVIIQWNYVKSRRHFRKRYWHMGIESENINDKYTRFVTYTARLLTTSYQNEKRGLGRKIYSVIFKV